MSHLIKKHWRSELVFLFSGLLIVLMLQMENQASSQTGGGVLRGYGGNLPSGIKAALLQMGADLKSADPIFNARPNAVTMADSKGRTITYRFAHETLWRNEDPVVPGVRSFHFEFRDEWGNLLTRSENRAGDIETVGYTICIIHRDHEIMAAGKTIVHSKAKGGKSDQVAAILEP